MGNEIPVQLSQFLRSILLGSTLALLYDVARALHVLGGRKWEALLDILVAVGSVASIFLFMMAEDGELRLFFLLGILGGAVLFFSAFSAVLRPILAFWIRIFLVPVRLSDIFLKKLYGIFKKVFPFVKKWFTIMGNSKRSSSGEERDDGRQHP